MCSKSLYLYILKNRILSSLNVKGEKFMFVVNSLIMEMVTDILKITLPGLLVLLTAYFMIRGFLKNDADRRRSELIMQSSKTVTPLRLQAYERIILLLERISLESLIMRTNGQGMSASQLQGALLNTIRSEFEHNLSQQIYVTPQAWEVVRNAKSNTIKIINSTAGNLPKEASAMDYSRLLLESIMELEKEPSRIAIDYVKSEVARLL